MRKTERENRKLIRRECAAMWLYREEYAKSGLGAIEFYKRLSSYDKRTVDKMIDEIMKAPEQLAAHGH